MTCCLTSSFAAVGYSPKPGGGAYDETDWTAPAEDNTAYIRSKAIAEGGCLELAVVNPTGIFGPVLGPRLSASTALVKAMLEGAVAAVPPVYFGVAGNGPARRPRMSPATGSWR
ncbi:hypothetical protein [Actinomadura sp. 21ATH]|uniref:hypothetical protein n=1 Tax=Actinomadura sp. 21ATH TaxID=1735444 RepID=UPI0035C2399D